MHVVVLMLISLISCRVVNVGPLHQAQKPDFWQSADLDLPQNSNPF
jgi:hypothetical protein